MDIKTTIEDYRTTISKGNVIVVFGSSRNCPACDQQTIVFDNLEKKGIMKMWSAVKVFLPTFMDEANKFSIRTVPCMVFFKNGSPCAVIPNFKKADEILALVKEHFL